MTPKRAGGRINVTDGSFVCHPFKLTPEKKTAAACLYYRTNDAELRSVTVTQQVFKYNTQKVMSVHKLL